MRAAVVRGVGETPVFGEVPSPVAGRGELRVTVTAAALSHVTRSRASGTHYSSAGKFPFVPGVDGVGRLGNGKRVYFFGPDAPNGSMAPETSVEASRVLPLPKDIDDPTAAAIAIPAASSWMALTDRAHMKRGETVLVNGATGASGSLAVRIAKHLGAGRVVATGRNLGILERLRSAGADRVVQLTDDEEAMNREFEAVFAQGVDIVLDYLWGRSARLLLIAAARAGDEKRRLRYVEIGAASGAEVELPAAVLRSSSIELLGSGIGSVPPHRLKAAFSAVFAAAGKARLAVPTELAPLSRIADFWVAEGPTSPRVVFTPDAT